MVTRNSEGLASLAMISILLAATGCGVGVRVGELRTESETVELGGAASVRVEDGVLDRLVDDRRARVLLAAADRDGGLLRCLHRRGHLALQSPGILGGFSSHSPAEGFAFSSAGKTLQPSDGRTLAYLETGNPEGRPVFYFHGSQARISRGFSMMRSVSKMVNFQVRPGQEDLVFMKELVEAGKVVPAIDRLHPLSEVAEAVRYYGEGHSRGKVVITV
jgi:hypothetical protein